MKNEMKIEYSDNFKNSKCLYKYRHFKEDFHLDILRHNKLYFSTKDQLNDPFDLSNSTYEIDIHSKEFYEYNLDIIEKRVNLYFGNNKKMKNSKIKEQITNLKTDIKNNNISIYRKLYDETINSTGIFSTTTDHLNILMWTHYSANLYGFCIGLNKNKILSYNKRKKDEFGILEVKYFDEIPQIQLNLKNTKEYAQLFALKSKDWKFEEEIRLFRFDCTSDNNKTIKFDINIVDEVILGSKCSQENKSRILEILNHRRNKGSHIKLLQLKINEDNFSLFTEEIKY